jgi:hypothetical protein
MVLRNFYITVMALMASVFMAVSANAVTISPNSATVHQLIFGVEYDAVQPLAKNVSFSHTYKFKVVDNPVSLNSFTFNGVSGSSFITLNLKLFDVAMNQVIASVNVLTAGGFTPVMTSLSTGGFYNLIVTGSTSGGNGRSYAFNVSAVPVPPALLLLASGLLGAGFMGRRRRTTTSVVV